VCLWVSEFPSINWTNLYESWYVYRGTWANLTPCLIYLFLPSAYVCVCVSLLSLWGRDQVKSISALITRQRLRKHIPAAANTRNNRIVGRVVFCAFLDLSKESLWVSMYPLSLLGNNSVKTFPQQRRIVWDIVSYAVRIVLKEWRKWGPHGTSYFI
jgi:hypothetical protein